MKTVLSIVVCVSMLAGVLVYVPGESAAAPIPTDAWVEGIVTSDGTTPVPGAYLMAMLLMGDGIQVNSTLTDGVGHYVMGIPSGLDIAVFTVHPEYYFGMAVARADAGETTGVDFTLTSIAPLVTDVLLKGYVLYEDGSPVVGGTLIGMVSAPSDGPPIYANFTSADVMGYYEVNVIPGDYGGGPAILDLPGYPLTSNATSEPLVSGMSYWVNLTLYPPQFNDDASIYGTVTDWDTGLPIAAALVTVESWNEWSGDSYSNWTLTDASGNYYMDVLNGSTRVMVTKSGYSLFMQENVDISSGESLLMDAKLVQTTTTITGNVFDIKTSLGIPYARVFMIDGLGNMTFAQTDSNGDYEMAGLSGENMTLGAQADGYGWNYTIATLSPGDSLNIDFGLLSTSAWLVGHVTDAMTGEPIWGANIYVYGASFEGGTNTNDTGYYNISVPAIELTVEITAWWNYNPNTTTVMIIDTTENVHDVALVPYRSVVLQGVVTDAFSGLPVVGANVQTNGGPTMTNETGEYNITVSSGEVWFNVQAPGYYQYNTNFWADEMTVVWLNVSLIPYSPPTTVLIYGWVNDSLTSTGIPSAQVRVSFPDGTYANSTWTLSDGYYEIWAPPYTLDITVWRSQYGMNFTSVDTTSLTDLWLDIELDPDMVSPMLSKTQDPTANVSANNPMWTYFELTDPNLRQVFWLMMMELNSSADGLWANYSLLRFGQMNLDPYQPDNSLGMSDIGNDTYMFQDPWPAQLQFGWASDGVTSVYTQEGWTWDPIDMTMRYSVRGLYSNATITDAWGQALFDMSTGEFVKFMFEMPIEPAPAGQFGATLDVVATVVVFEPWTPYWPTDLSDTVLGTLDVSTATWTADYTVPSGNYRTCLAAGDWGDNYVTDTTNFTVDNDPPVANAGADMYVVVNTQADVDGSASTDNVGIIDYYWQFMNETGVLVEFYTESFSYTFTVVGDYSVLLVVWDGGLNIGSDEIVIHVVEDSPPVANAGPDMEVPEDSVAVFNGSASDDDVGIDNYTWTIVELSVVMYDVAPTYTFPDVGTYNVELNVTDTIGQWSVDSMVVTVTDATVPIADAGSDATVDLGSSVTLDGSASSDNVGIVSWTWTFFDGSDQLLTGDVVPYTFTTLGDHTVTLEVADAVGLTATDTVVISVLDGTAPTAAAGADQTIGLGDSATLDGSGSSDNVGVVSWTWTFTDGTPQTLLGETASYTFTTLGAHTVTLEVADAAGLTATDTVVITVVDDIVPIARAGPDQTVPMGTSVDFDGSSSTDNVGVVSYVWTFNDGGMITRTGVSPSYTFDNAGVFVVTLTVEDDAGLSDTDTMTVTVEDTESPIADAGEDQYVVTGEAVTFNGTGSSDNVGVTNYTWTFTDDVAVTLYGVTPSYAFSAAGDTTVTLTVSDAAGNTDTDTVVMHVTLANEGPTANAGEDQTVSAGDTVSFDGSDSSDDAGYQNLNYTWHIVGTDIYMYGLYPEHVFDEPGTYVVNLTVTDDGDLTDTDSVTIVVEEKAKSFVESYWWLLVVVAIVIIGVVIFFVMKKGTGGSSAGSDDEEEEVEDESVEDEAPPEDDEL